jgi:pyruvate/2-oxoglutarate dehydrogenase complex dihydrolipoamide acyltransferase (E2) component
MNLEIRIPDIGDFKDVEIIEILIKPGAKIKKNDTQQCILLRFK